MPVFQEKERVILFLLICSYGLQSESPYKQILEWRFPERRLFVITLNELAFFAAEDNGTQIKAHDSFVV
jgi:hypothetical protein